MGSALDYYYNKSKLWLPMKAENHDPVNDRTLDVSGNNNHADFNMRRTLRASVTNSGYAALSEYLTIAGTTRKNTFRYEGGSATTALWTATTGDNLVKQGTNEKLVDGNMEAAGVAAWGSSGVTLSKEVGGAHTGTQWLKATVVSTAYFFQAVIPAGRTYRLTGWAKSDGVLLPRIAEAAGSVTIWTGTTSTAWQPFDITFRSTSTANSRIMFYSILGAGFTGWDDLSITEELLVDEYAPGLTDSRVKFNGDEYYEAASADYAKPGTDDLVIEFMYKHSDTLSYFFSKYISAANSIRLLTDTGLCRLALNGVYVDASASMVEDEWYHVIFFLDRSGNGIGYINGSAGSPVSIAALAAVDFGAAAKWILGSRTGGGLPTDASLSYLAMWQGAAWLDTHLQADIAKERFHQACGVWPELSQPIEYLADGDMEAAGTSAYGATNATLTKSSVNPHSGTQALRVTSLGGSPVQAWQNPLIVNERYTMTGWMRGDGTVQPLIGVSSDNVLGTTSTTWQPFKLTFVAKSTYIGFLIQGGGVGNWVEFDNVQFLRSGGHPRIATRASRAYVSKLNSFNETLLVPVAPSWMRACEHIDLAATKMKGYLPEPTITNICKSSQETTTGWAYVHVGDGAAVNARLAPDGTLTAYAGTADAVDTAHGFDHAGLVQVAGPYTYSVWASPNAVTRLKIECTTIANAYAYFDVHNGIVETVGAAAVARISRKTIHGYYRCEMTFTSTAATHVARLLSIETDNDDTFVGNGVDVSTYIWGMQFENYGHATSYIKTTGVIQARATDSLRLMGKENIGGENIQQGAVEFDILLPNYANSLLAAFTLTDGGSAAQRLLIYTAGSPGQFQLITSGGCTTITTSDLTDGIVHRLRSTYDLNNFTLAVDGTVESIDNLGTVPTGIDRIDVGQGQIATAQIAGLIGEINVYSTPDDTHYTKKVRRGYSFSELTTFGVTPWNPTTEGTLVALVNTTTPLDSLIMGSFNVDTDYCCLRIRDDRLCGGIGDENWETILGTTRMKAQQHYFVAITWDGTTVNLYLDDNLEYTGAQSGAVAGTYPIAIGAISDAGDSEEQHKGDIFQAAAFDFALDVPQLQDFKKLMYRQVNHV